MIDKALHKESFFRDIDGVTALALAAGNGLAAVIEVLKQKVRKRIIDVNASCGASGMTALHYAVKYTLDAHIADDKNADDEAYSGYELHTADEGHDTIAVVLSIRGIDVNQYNRCGETALEFAVSQRNVLVVEALLKHEDMKISPDLLASSVKNPEILQLLRSYGEEKWFPDYENV
ncbi:hypothetical protein LTR17_027600 [Elasticomyces elasticus]|nr:hypothetical protein LTR17_027600 [Elasticomyces elasticus]